LFPGAAGTLEESFSPHLRTKTRDTNMH